MKIEIGESLALSYLKHVKKCVLYQNNWKISSKWAKPCLLYTSDAADEL